MKLLSQKGELMLTVSAVGRVTADFELQTGAKTSYARFNLAVNKGFGENEHTVFLQCVLFDKAAERIINAKVKRGNSKLIAEKQSGYSDMDEANKIAALLCDNLYRRIENADNLGDAGIKTNISRIGNIQALTPLNLNKGAYAPASVMFGEFQIL